MLELYLGALGVGGTLLVASLVLGGHHASEGPGLGQEVESDADSDSDSGGEAEHHDGVDAAAVLEWLPVTSIRFWTFFLAFFGITGAVLTIFELGGTPMVVGGVSLGLGYVCGLTSVAVVKSLRRHQTGSTVGVEDAIGATALVRIGISKESAGKVRVVLRGRNVEFIAHTEDETPIPVNSRVMVYGTTDNGDALVTLGDAELGEPQHAPEQGEN